MNREDAPQNNISWTTLEHAYRPKHASWFGALGILAAAGVVASILLNNFLFAVLIVVGGLVLGLVGARRPEPITISLTNRGILAGNRLYPYQSLVSFWVSFETDPPRLILQPKSRLTATVSFFIEDLSPDDVRLYLLDHLKEEELEEASLPETIAHRLGF
jgi:hypothetical protein